MQTEIATRLTNKELLKLIEEAGAAEMCRDVDALRNILQRVWKDNNRLPTFEEYEPPARAELLRLCGFFLTFYGRCRNQKDFQLQAKDVLTNAIDIFQSEDLPEKAAESKIILAFCYWNSGEVSECEALLSLVENDFSDNKIHPVYLQIQINRLLILAWNEKYDEAIETINKISGSMELCSDLRLKAMFHSEAGITFRRAKRFEDALFHYREALRITTQIGNERFVALNLNNLALLYRDLRDFKSAHDFADKALKLYSELGDKGWIPHVLDTKSLILIDEKKYGAALKTIEEALSYFYKGEDFDGLTAALWTKVLCLIRMQRAEDAVITFIELEKIALENIGEIAVRKFTKNLTEEIYFLRHLPLTEEVSEFKRSQVKAALIEANGVVGKAAKILRVKNHQALSEILNKQFPGLLGELGFKRRARRTIKS